MKKLAVVLMVLLLVGCQYTQDIQDILDEIVVTPTKVGVIASPTPTVTPVIITATPEPTSTPSPTSTPDPNFIPSPTPVINFTDDCVWEQYGIVCMAEICNVRTEPLPGDEHVAYGVPRSTMLQSLAVCKLGNESWYYVGVNANSKPLWARNLETIWLSQ